MDETPTRFEVLDAIDTCIGVARHNDLKRVSIDGTEDDCEMIVSMKGKEFFIMIKEVEDE